ncbi:MAG: hypothetical protein QOG64_2112, partial [Acidimicrobiaceae bacterium]|nr:hypothetical protein [Acidimicrobiaceae bacterium]
NASSRPYWLASNNGSVWPVNGAPDLGSLRGTTLTKPIVGMTVTASQQGYWLVASDGGVFSFGDAGWFGSTGAMHLNKPIVGIAPTATGKGYWLFAGDGGIFSFGDAQFFGSTGAMPLNQPIVGMASTPSGAGYWLVASDGGIFTFGDGRFSGSTGDIKLNKPIVAMAATVGGGGYWLAASDGGIFTFGDAPFLGSQGGQAIPAPVVGMDRSTKGDGYWLVGQDSQVYPFGSADYGSGATGSTQAPAVGIAGTPDGGGYWIVHGDRLITKISDSGDRVRQIQQRLLDLGYWIPGVDGAYGDTTRQAVYAFQKLNNLPINGQVDEPTTRSLERAVRPTPSSASGDLVEVDKTHQVLYVVRAGRAQWVFNTSTGTERPYTFEGRQYIAHTPTGNFTVQRVVDGYDNGPLGQLYRPRYFTSAGHALHGYTSVPPYPASHGCVRLSNPGIDFIWGNNLAPIGSTVFVYGTSPGT